MKDEYNASNIQIREYSDEPWIAAIALAEKYNKSAELIQRGLEACQLAGVEPSYYIDRYLRGLPVPVNQDVNTIYKEQQRVNRC